MKNSRKIWGLLVVLCTLLVNSPAAFSSHIMGGTVTYKHLGDNKYAVEFLIFRDCGWGNAPMPSYVQYNIRGASSSFGGSTRYVPLFGNATSVNSTITACASNNYCSQRGIFRDTITLGNDTKGYHLWYSVCCRNSATLNISPNNSSWYAFVPPKKFKNTSPAPVKDLVPTICAGRKNIFNASIYDADGDSLVFSLVAPYDNINPPSFNNVSYRWGYNVTYPFGTSSDAPTIDPETGEITAYPKSQGNYALAVNIAEYRVDPVTKVVTKLGDVRIDLQFIAVNCGSATANQPPGFEKDTSGLTRIVDPEEEICITINGIDTNKVGGVFDVLKLSASGSMMGTIPGFPQPHATFPGDTASQKVSSKFCWKPSCDHITYTSPHLVTFKLTDNGCNELERTYKIYVKPKSFVQAPNLQCLSILSDNIIQLQWDTIPKDTLFKSYVIYRKKEKDEEFTPVKTLYNQNYTGWIDSSAANALDTTYQYYIRSANSCEHEGATSDTFTSIVVKVTGTPNGKEEIKWNSLKTGLKDSFIVQVNQGTGWVNYDTITTRTFLIDKCFKTANVRVLELKNSTKCQSVSSWKWIADTIPPIGKSIFNTTGIDGNKVKVTFIKSKSTDIKSYIVQRAEKGGAFVNIDTVAHIKNTDTLQNFTDNNAAYLNWPLCYKITALDECNNATPYIGSQCVTDVSGTTLQMAIGLKWTHFSGYNISKYSVESLNSSNNWQTVATLGTIDSTFTHSNLDCKTYKYRIKAEQNFSPFRITYSDTISVNTNDTIAPEQPEVEYATVKSSSSIEIKFAKSTALDLKEYRIWYNVNGGTMQALDTIPTSSAGTFTYLHTGINPVSNAYCYEIRSVDQCKQNVSKPIKMCVVHLDGTEGNYKNDLLWTAYKALPVKQYRVEEKIASVWVKLDSAASYLNYTHLPLECNKARTYRIAITDTLKKYTVYSNEKTLTPFDTEKPIAPFITHATYLAGDVVEIHWNKTISNDVKQYILYRKNASNPFAVLDTLNYNITSYKDTLPNALPEQYCYAIKAIDSCARNISNFSTTHCPVSILADTNICHQKIFVDWTAYAGWGNVKEYRVHRAENSGPEALLATVGGNSISFTDTAVSYLVKYCYRIEAVMDTGTITSFSSSSCEKTYTPDTPHIYSASKIVTSANNGEVLLKWKSVSGKRFYHYYNIWHKLDGDPSFTLIKSNIPITQNSFIHKNINTESLDHVYKIAIVDSCGNNKTLFASEHKTMTLDAAVSQLTHKLWWSPYKGFEVDSYFVERLEGGNFTTMTVLHSDTQTVIFPAPCNYHIFYRVKAVDKDGNFAYSDTIGKQALDTIASNPAIFKNASVTSGNTVEVDFIGADSADMYLYVIQRSNNGSWGTAGSVEFTTAAALHKFIDTTSTLKDVLCYTIVTLDSCLNASLGDTFCVPQLHGTALNQSNSIAWHPFAGYPVKNYNIYRWENGWNLHDINAGTDTTFFEDTLHCALPYHYKVEAVGDVFTSFSDSITLTPFDTLRPPPAELRFVNVKDDHTVEIAWRYDTKSDVKYFDIYRSDNGVNFSKVGNTIFDSSFVDATADPLNKTLKYYVVSIDSCNVTHRSVPSDTDVVSFITLRNGSCFPVIFMDWSNYGSFASGTEELEIYRRESTSTSWLKVKTLPATATTYNDTVPDKDLEYCFKIVAKSKEENFIASSANFCLTPWIFPLPDSALMVYTSVAKTGKTNGEIFIEWPVYDSIADTFARGYNIYHSTGQSNDYKLVHTTTNLSTNTYIHSGQNTSDSVNNYSIAVYNLCDRDGKRSVIHKTINLEVQNNNLEAILSWNKYKGEVVLSYEIYKRKNSDPQVLIAILSSADTTYTDTNLLCQQHYNYTLKANLKNGKISVADTVGIDAFDIIPPSAPNVHFATVDRTHSKHGEITVQFVGNSEKNRNGYILYRSQNGGAFAQHKIIANVSTSSIIIQDTAINTAKNTYSYYFTGTDSCGNESLPSDTHTVVHLKVKAFSEYIKIDWSHYKHFSAYQYMVERRMNGGAWEYYGNWPSATKTLIDSAVKCFQFYEYRITSIENSSPFTSLSNIAGDTAFETVLPIIPFVKRVTVTTTDAVDGTTLLEWEKSTSKDAATYLVERSTNGIIWNSVSPQLTALSFADKNLNTHQQTYYYRIWVTDSCKNISATATAPHQTIVLDAEPGNQQVNLSWNAYDGWPVATYNIYRENAFYASVPGSKTSFTDTFVLCINNYEYYIEAVSANDASTISRSNTDSAQPWDFIAPRPVYLKSVTVNLPNKETKLEWTASTSFDARQYYIYKINAVSGKVDYIDSTADLEYVHVWQEDISRPDCYIVKAGDHCKNASVESNRACIIILQTSHESGYNTMKWNKYTYWKDGVFEYNIYRNEDSLGWIKIGNSTQLNFTDDKLGEHVIDYCYRVEAVENAGEFNATSLSTVQCVHQDPVVYFPNAFTPDYSEGINDQFGPVGMYISNYQMKIFNRWGQVIFETNDGGRWNGKLPDGSFAPMDLYTYQFTIDGYNPGKKYFNGKFILLR